jgi:hypothetical protein
MSDPPAHREPATVRAALAAAALKMSFPLDPANFGSSTCNAGTRS